MMRKTKARNEGEKKMKMTKRVGFATDEPASDLPPDLAEALIEADVVLSRHDKMFEVLRTTHQSIPEALKSERELGAQLGLAEVAGGGDTSILRRKLTDMRGQRETDIRRRQSATQSLLDLEADLSAARERVNVARTAYASTVITEFNGRYSDALAVIARLQEEGRSLGMALRTFVHLPTVPTKPPAVPAPSFDQIIAGFREVLRPPDGVERIGATLDRLDSSLALAGGIRQAGERDRTHARLAEVRVGMVAEQTGVFRAVQPFVCPSDGLRFEVGSLLDRSLIGPGALHRLLTARFLRPVDRSGASAAA
jgi:hypothetical protein